VGGTSARVIGNDSLLLSKRSDAADSKAISEAFTQLRLDDGSAVFTTRPSSAPYLDRKLLDESAYARKSIQRDASNGFFAGAPVTAHAEAAYIHVGYKSVSSLQFYQGSRLLPIEELDLIVVAAGDSIRAYRPGADPEQVWALQLKDDPASAGGARLTPPAFAGGYVFVATLGGTVLQTDPEAGSVKASYATGQPLRSQPVVHEGRIFAGSATGKLVVVDTRDRTLTGWGSLGGGSDRRGR